MAEPKTQATKASAKAFLNQVKPEQKRADSLALLRLFQKTTGEKPVMWGTSIVGFGKWHYKSDRSSQEGDWPLVSFSPRKQSLTLYLWLRLPPEKDLLRKLGKHKVSGSCLHINKLADVDQGVLSTLISKCYKHSKKLQSRI